MRLFVGIYLSSAMNEEVSQFIKSNLKNSKGFKWTSPENLHFTLKFLGEVSIDILPDLKFILKKAVERFPEFYIHLSGFGLFPEKGNPRIIWIDLNKDDKMILAKLAESINNVCCELGFLKEKRPFQPHLTIARTCARAQDERVEINILNETKFLATTYVKGVSLIESKLMSNGPIYQEIEYFGFEK